MGHAKPKPRCQEPLKDALRDVAIRSSMAMNSTDIRRLQMSLDAVRLIAENAIKNNPTGD